MKSRQHFALLCLALLAGCAGLEDKGDPDYYAIEPIDYPDVTVSTAPATGSLYTSTRNVSLFTDTRAHQVGDIVSVILTEATSAAKSADTELDKSNDIEVIDPLIFGAPVTAGDGRYNLGTSISSGGSFAGEASSNQSNRLSGAIAVQVSQVLPNGNLVVQGEKWLRLNQGDEYIRLRGIIRPEDVSPTNTVPSTLVADARISYGGTGALNQTNSPGWLTRFFMSPLMPF